MTIDPIDVRVARPAEWPAVAFWTFEHIPGAAAGARADRLIQLFMAGEIAPHGILVATRGGRCVGGIVAQHLPGGTAVVLPPGGESDRIRDSLAAALVAGLRATGVAVGQAFFDPDELPRAAVLTRHGFAPVTTIIQMSLDEPVARPPAHTGPEVTLVDYAEADPGVFADTLLRTYEDSLDVPEAAANRTAAEVVAGHQFGQPAVPHWWLAVDPAGAPVGVMLMSLNNEAALEVTYLGVVPAARRRGFGEQMLVAAINLAAVARRSLHLTVDQRNRPALRLYRRLHFCSRHSQRVFLWIGANWRG